MNNLGHDIFKVLLLCLYTIGTVTALSRVAKGEHATIERPLDSAISAVACVILFWLVWVLV